MVKRYAVTITDLPPEMAGPDGRLVIDYTADDDSTTTTVHESVQVQLGAYAAPVGLDPADLHPPIVVTAVG